MNNPQDIIDKEFKKCKSRLYSKLLLLKKCGILSQSLVHSSSHAVGTDRYPIQDNILLNAQPQAFESLEFYGDSVLQHEVSKSIIQTKQFLSPHLLTQFRTHTVSNRTLSVVFQSLGLDRLMVHPHQGLLDEKKLQKEKGDCLEAMVGEMAQFVNSTVQATVLQQTCQHTLKELISYIVYAGELSYHSTCIFSDPPSPTSTPTKDQSKNNFKKTFKHTTSVPDEISSPPQPCTKPTETETENETTPKMFPSKILKKKASRAADPPNNIKTFNDKDSLRRRPELNKNKPLTTTPVKDPYQNLFWLSNNNTVPKPIKNSHLMTPSDIIGNKK
ncbi:ribonuclease 3 [Acrasis kona]|uniref:Ribonuclease 3 n=1 Tax=Acrasis kona TaxID=1008807 RepID=A0AAW2ZHU4_9EUKA